MADVATHDWRGFGAASPSVAELFDPKEFEARLVEARARRSKALADREADRSRTVPPVQPAPAARPDTAWPRPEQGLVFLAGLAVGIGAVAAVHMLRPAPAPAPHVATVLSVPAWPQPPAVIAAMPGRGDDPLPAGLPMLVAPLLEPGVGAPEPAFAVAAVVSKAREASVAAGLPQLRLAEAPPGSSIARPRLGVPASADGPDPGVAAFDPNSGQHAGPGRPSDSAARRASRRRSARSAAEGRCPWNRPGTAARQTAEAGRPDAQATDAAQASDADAVPAGPRRRKAAGRAEAGSVSARRQPQRAAGSRQGPGPRQRQKRQRRQPRRRWAGWRQGQRREGRGKRQQRERRRKRKQREGRWRQRPQVRRRRRVGLLAGR